MQINGWRAGMIAMLAAVLCGCAGSPSKPAEAKARISAASNVNPNSDGRPSPVHVRIFQLKEGGAFMDADFWSLMDKEQETLGPSLVQRQEYDLAPGESREFKMEIAPEARVLGVMAEFADYRNAEWRVVAQAPNKTLSDILRKDRVLISIGRDAAKIFVGD